MVSIQRLEYQCHNKKLAIISQTCLPDEKCEVVNFHVVFEEIAHWASICFNSFNLLLVLLGEPYAYCHSIHCINLWLGNIHWAATQPEDKRTCCHLLIVCKIDRPKLHHFLTFPSIVLYCIVVYWPYICHNEKIYKHE